MRVGFIFECGPNGADVRVIEKLALMIVPGLDFVPITLDDKGRLLKECAEASHQLITSSGCERVFIIWDLIPPDRGACRKKDREFIIATLEAKGLPMEKIVLLCIEQELESWLIADGRALSELLSTPSHKKSFDSVKQPDLKVNPKKALNRIFSQTRFKFYNDLDHAVRIVSKITDFKKVKKSTSFCRFHFKLSGKQP